MQDQEVGYRMKERYGYLMLSQSDKFQTVNVTSLLASTLYKVEAYCETFSLETGAKKTQDF